MSDAHTGYPRFFFLHLLTILTLYASVLSTIILLFQYINLLFPDPLSFHLRGSLDSIRWSAALVLIMFPVLLVSSWFIERDLQHHPEHAEYRIRKWLLTFTIFLAALVIIGDLTTLLYNFLSGELTVSFVLKILAVLLIAAAVFGYEMRQLRRKDFGRSPRERLIAWGSTGGMLAVIAIGLFLAGSPMEQRRVRFDDRRISDLQMLQGQVIEHWIAKQKLPEALSDLESPLTGFVAPKDPKTGQPYEYRAIKPRVFELCALFETDTTAELMTRETMPRGPYGIEPYGAEHWQHGTGRTCFERTIDPTLYRDRVPVKPLR